MKVHSRLRIPSERFSSLTRRMTRKSRKNVMDTDAFSESYTQKQDLIKKEKINMLFFIKANVWLTAISCMGFVSCANEETAR